MPSPTQPGVGALAAILAALGISACGEDRVRDLAGDGSPASISGDPAISGSPTAWHDAWGIGGIHDSVDSRLGR